MSEILRGRRLALSPMRRLVIEMLRQARKQPSIPVARTLQVGQLATLRRRSPQPISWTALFVKAYGLTARRFPELRRAYVPWPWPHLYEHPVSVAAVVIERQLQEEPILLAARIVQPESLSAATITAHLRRFKEAPLESISDFRQLRRLARLPRLLQRLIFWRYLGWCGARRARRLGTFMVSSYGRLGAEQLHPLCPLTSLLTFGPIAADGRVVVKVIYDHRVVDGAQVARALAELERILHEDLLLELQHACEKAA